MSKIRGQTISLESFCLTFLAEANFAKGDYEKAFTLWQEAKKINEGDDLPYLGLAKYYRQKGMNEKAKKRLEECRGINDWSQECQKK